MEKQMMDLIRDPREEGIKGLKGISRGQSMKLSPTPMRFSPEKLGGRDLINALILGRQQTGPQEFVGTPDYGLSRYDDDITHLSEILNIDEARANIQPWYDLIAAGILKGGTLAATTFADGVVGTIVGALNVLANADKIDSARELGNLFINNPWSVKMLEINHLVESVLPNYYTQAEREEPWWENIFTANFIGDKFLKNLGFTIGAAYSGKLTANIASKAMGLKGVRDAFKGAVTTASGKTLNTASDIAKAYKSGDAFMDGVKLTDDLGKAAKQLKNAEWLLKTIGAVNAAMGEGRIEAISNSKEWFDYNKQLLDADRENKINSIENDLFLEHPEWFGLVRAGENNFIRTIVSPEGQAEWERRKGEIELNHTAAIEKITKDRANMANAIFGMNVALLSASNLWQFGRFMSGGYNSGRVAKNLIKGSRKEGFKESLTPYRMQMAKAVSNPFMEAQEEMSQSMIQETTGLKYASELNDFYGAKVNPDAEELTVGWLDAAAKGFSNTYGNILNWEEGFIGGLTGLLGIPKIKMKKADSGKVRPSITFEGELWEGIRDAKAIKKESLELAKALNDRIQQPDFLNYYQGAIRHNKYQNDMEAALDKGDNFAYKNAEHSLLVSDVIMFDKAGRLQDLYDIIDEAGTVSREDVELIKSMTIDKSTGKSIFEGKTDEQVREHVKKQVEDTKSKIDNYVKISNDLKTLYGEDISADFLEEMTWMLTLIDDWEGRTKSILGDVRNILSGKAQELKDKYGIDVDTTIHNLDWAVSALTSDDNVIDEINEIINDLNMPIEEGRARIENLIREKEKIRNTSGLKLGNEIKHIRKLARERRASLNKRLNQYLNTRELEKQDAEKLYLQELLSLIDELYDYYNLTDHYSELKKEDLELQAKEAFDRYYQNTQDIDAAFDAAENIVMRTLVNPLIVLEGTKPGESTWERNRETKARLRLKELSASLFSQIVALKDMLTTPEYTTLSPIDVLNIGEKLIDLIKMYATRASFIDKYNSLAKNPQLFTERAQAEIDNVLKSSEEKAVNTTADNIKANPTLKGIKEIAGNTNPGIMQRAIEKINSEDNEELKKVVNNYDELNRMKEGVADIAKGLPETPDNISAINVINDALENSESIDEVNATITTAIATIGGKVGDSINNILDEYNRLGESEKTSKKDSNTPKKKLKKKLEKKEEEPKGFLDSLSDTDDISEEEYTAQGTADTSTESKAAPPKLEGVEEPPIKVLRLPDNIDEVVEKAIANPRTEILEGGGYSVGDVILWGDEKNSSIGVIAGVYPLSRTTSYDVIINLDKSKDTEYGHEVWPVFHLSIKQKIKASPTKSESTDSRLDNLNSEELEKVAKGEKDIEGTNESNKEDLQELATRMLEDRKAPPVHSEDSDAIDIDPEVELPETLSGYLRSWAISQYRFNELKDRTERKAVLYSDPKVPALQQLGAFDFVDNGSLGVLFNDNKNLPIHYIVLNDGPLKNIPLLAIEVTGDVNPINPITAQNGVKYQVVGSLGFNKSDKLAIRNYNNIIRALTSEIMELDRLPKVFVSEMTTKIKHIYSGRMVKSDESSGVEQRPLKTILHGETPHFGIYYSETSFKTPTLDEYQEVVTLNLNNANPRRGSIWLMTREADGRYYPKHIRIKRVSEQQNVDSPIMKEIIRNLEILADPSKDRELRYKAKYNIERMIYFPEGVRILFNEDSVSITGYENNIGEGMNPLEKALELLSALTDEELNLRFLIIPSKLTEEDYVLDLLDSDIFTTDLLYLHNVNASFDVYMTDIDSGEPVVDDEPTKGHTGRRGINNSIAGETIIHNGSNYKLAEGIVYLNGDRVTDLDIIDEVKFISAIKAKTVLPIPGSRNLYIGTHKDGTEFGVVNYRIKTGEELQALKDKYKKGSSRKLSEDEVAKLLTSTEETNEEAPISEGLFESAEDFTPPTDEDVELSGEGLLEPTEDRLTNDDYLSYVESINPSKNRPVALDKAIEQTGREEADKKDAPTMNDKFSSSNTLSIEQLQSTSISFDSLIRENLDIVAELGFDSIKELKDFLNDDANDLPRTETINSEEKFKTAINQAKKCR